MVTNVNWTYVDHFAVYTNAKLLHRTPEISMLYVHYTSIKKCKSN